MHLFFFGIKKHARHVTPGRLSQTHPRDGDDFNRMRSESDPRRHQRKRRIAFGGRIRYFVAEFVDTGKMTFLRERERCLEFGHGNLIRARARKKRARALVVLLLDLLRLASL